MIPLLGVFLISGKVSAQDSTSLQAFSQTEVELSNRTPSQRFSFDTEADSVWSFSAATLTGDLDPVLSLYDADENLLLANDNESRGSSAARLENWTAPDEGTYYVEVGRANPDRLSTAGSAVLTITQDPNSIALSPLPIPDELHLEMGQTYEVIAQLLPDQTPARLSFTLSDDLDADTTMALELRSGFRSGSLGWLLRFGEEQVGLVQTTQESGQSVELPLSAVPYDHASGSYTVLLAFDSLTLMREDETIATFEGNILPRGVLSLRFVGEGDSPVTIEQPYASAPFYGNFTDPLDALPPLPSDERLYHASDPPTAALRELEELGYVTGEGSLIFNIPDAVIETSAAGFSNVPLRMAHGYQDFVLYFEATPRLGGAGSACGMTIRQEDAATFVTVVVSEDGNVYILPYEAGALAETALASQSLWVDRGIGTLNRVLLVVQGDQALMFVNGALVGGVELTQRSGLALFTMVVNEPILSRCTFNNIWMWDLGE